MTETQMAPSQHLSDLDIRTKQNFLSEAAQVQENVNKKKVSNCNIDIERTIGKVEPFLGEQSEALIVLEDVDVDIVNVKNKNDCALTETEDPDATEFSSSFANTASDTEMCSRLSEAEVESKFFGEDGFGSAFGGFGSPFQVRKKKVTDHWRSYIRPLMWRCKWTELRIKEIESQISKYSKILSEYDQRKNLTFNQHTSEEFGSKSLPFSSHQYRSKAIKRRKRRKIEDVMEITCYMSHHNLFSYFENRKSGPDGTSLADDLCNPVIPDLQIDTSDRFSTNDDLPFFEFRDGTNSLEHLLWTIETVHSRVGKLKNQIDVVMAKSVTKFSSSENLSHLALCDFETSSAHSPTFSAANGDTLSVGPMCNPTQHVSEYDVGDLVLPDSAISSFGVAAPIPDIIESTVGLLSTTDIKLHQPQARESCEDIVDNVLVNEAAKADVCCLKITNQQSMVKLEVPEKIEHGETAGPSVPTTESIVLVKSVVPQEQSTLKSCLSKDVHFPKNKRKRGERKAGAGGWSKKCPGEPDSQ